MVPTGPPLTLCLCSWQTAWDGLRVLWQQSLGTPTVVSPEPSACTPWSPSATCTGPRAGTRVPRVRAGCGEVVPALAVPPAGL